MRLLPVLAALVLACAPTSRSTSGEQPTAGGDAGKAAAAHGDKQPLSDPTAIFGRAAPDPGPGLAVAVFAGGCFWCMEGPFDQVEGVVATTSGYTDGPEIAPSYEEVGGHRTGHAEALRVLYDPTRVSYARLLDVFWHNVDPTQKDGQFCDHGAQYRTGIYTSQPEERALALQSRDAVAARLGKEVATEIDVRGPFWPAEDYHQDFWAKEPAHYQGYRAGCGRDARLRELWGEAAVVGEGEAWIVAAGPAPTLPTPFTAEQLRAALPVGSVLRMAHQAPDGAYDDEMQVIAADADAVTMRMTRLVDGKAQGEVREVTFPWTELRDHAAFPVADTRVEEREVELEGVRHSGRRYVVSSVEEGVPTVTTYDFALDLPGPPIQMTVVQGGVEVLRMRLAARQAGG